MHETSTRACSGCHGEADNEKRSPTTERWDEFQVECFFQAPYNALKRLKRRLKMPERGDQHQAE